jgi:hypothetical protein
MDDHTKYVLRSPDFKPTRGVTTEIAVLKGMLWNDNDRTTKEIRTFADERKFTAPNTEVACLICDMFMDEEIEVVGLWRIIAMHEPVEDSNDDLRLLSVVHEGTGCCFYLESCLGGYDDSMWSRNIGFAFAMSQVSSQH